MDFDYIRKLKAGMVADLERRVCDGEPFQFAKDHVLGSTKMVINLFAKRDVLKFFDRIKIEHLSEPTRRVAALYDLYPEFRAKGRPPTILERIRSQFFS